MGGRQVRVDGELLEEGEFLVEREAENAGLRVRLRRRPQRRDRPRARRRPAAARAAFYDLVHAVERAAQGARASRSVTGSALSSRQATPTCRALRFLEEGDVRAVLEERNVGAQNAARQCLRNRRRAGRVRPDLRWSFRRVQVVPVTPPALRVEPSENGLFLDWPRHSA